MHIGGSHRRLRAVALRNDRGEKSELMRLIVRSKASAVSSKLEGVWKRGAGRTTRCLAAIVLKEGITKREGKQEPDDGEPENLAPNAVHFLVYAAVHADVARVLILLCRYDFFWVFLPLILIPLACAVAVKVRLEGLDEFCDFVHIRHSLTPPYVQW